MENTNRYIPAGYREFKPEMKNYKKDLFSCYVNLENPYRAIFYIGKRSRAAWHYRFENIELLKKEVNEAIGRLMRWEELKEKRKEQRKEEIKNLKIGQLFVYSWGYDQTNVEFYQLTEIIGKKFKMRQIAKKIEFSEGLSSMAAYAFPWRDNFLGETILKSSLSMKFGCLTKTEDGQKHYFSCYA